MLSFHDDILARAKANTNFRTTIVTGVHSQVTLMAIKPGEDVGEEVHDTVDQVLIFVAGSGKAVVAGEEYPIAPETLVHVPAGTRHNFINVGNEDLKIVSIYAPPQHPAGTIHVTKADATKAEEAEHA